MKHSKRMLAVVAATGLAMGTLPGVANAQSAELGLGLDAALGGSAELGVELGLGAALGSVAPEGDLEGSLEDLNTESLGPSEGGSLDEGSLGEGGSLEPGENGSLEEGSLDTDNGSLEEGSLDPGENGSLEEGSLNPDSGEPGQNGGSLENLFDGLDLGELSTESATGSDVEDENDSSLEGIFSGSLNDDDELDFGSLIPEDGSLEGSNGGENGGDGGNGGDDSEGEGSVANLDAETILALGSLAGAGIAIGVAVNGGVDLPPLPDVNVGAVCDLPPEAIDFLKGNGSMEQDECEPEEQN